MNESETYIGKINFYSTASKGTIQKYVTILLPEDTEFNPFEKISVSLSRTLSDAAQDFIGHADSTLPCYQQMRDMDINQTLLFPFNRWKAVRASASSLKKGYGALFNVHKLGKIKEVGDISVTRLA